MLCLATPSTSTNRLLTVDAYVAVEAQASTDYFTSVGVGFCRTPSGGTGTVVQRTTGESLTSCMDNCIATASCVGVEFVYSSGTCEVHSAAVTYGSGSTSAICY